MNDDPLYVARWMSTDLITTSSDAVLSDALAQMEDARIRHLPVTEGDTLVGLLSDRDARRLVHGEQTEGSDACSVGDVMTAADKLKCIDPGTLVRSAAEVLCREKISSLPVIAGERLVGIVTSEDLLWAFLDLPE